MKKETRPLSRSHTLQGGEKMKKTGEEGIGRWKRRRRRSTESAVLNWEDNAISVSLGVSAEDLTVNRV